MKKILGDRKICTKCKQSVLRHNFVKDKRADDGLHSWCKDCKKISDKQYYSNNKEKAAIYGAKRYKENRTQIRAVAKIYSDKTAEKNKIRANKWYYDNRDRAKVSRKEYRIKNKTSLSQSSKTYRNKNKEKIKIQKHNSYLKNKETIIKKSTAYTQLKRQTDPVFKTICNLRRSIGRYIKLKKLIKNNPTKKIIGCTPKELQQHLDQSFIDNYGREYTNEDKLHIDHIVPLSRAKTIEKVEELNHYSNLQYLLAKDNLAKGSKCTYEIPKQEKNR